MVSCLLTIIAVRGYPGVHPPAVEGGEPITVLNPLAGVEDQLEDNLRTFFTQRYQNYEILFAVRQPEDPAVAVVEKLRVQYPGIPARLIVTGEPPYPTANASSLYLMKPAAPTNLLFI